MKREGRVRRLWAGGRGLAGRGDKRQAPGGRGQDSGPLFGGAAGPMPVTPLNEMDRSACFPTDWMTG